MDLAAVGRGARRRSPRGSAPCARPAGDRGPRTRTAPRRADGTAGASVMRSRLVVAHGLPSVAPMAHQYIFQMHRLTKAFPPDKTVLKDITLAFLPGREDRRARLQRRGQVDAAATSWPGATPTSAATRCSRPARPSACSSRSRTSTRARTCAATSRTASPGPRALLDRFNELAANYSDETADEFAAPPGADRRRRRVEPRHERRVRDGRAAPAARPTPTSRRSPAASAAASRCAGCCSRRPTCCCSTSRRTTSTPSRSRGSSSTSPSTRAPSSRSPTIATSSTTSPAGSSSSTAARGHPVRGQLLELARAEAGAPRAGGAHREGAPADDRGRARVGAPEPQGPPDEAEGAPARTTRRCVAQERNVKLDEVQIHIPAGPRLGDVVVEAEHLRKGFGDRLLIDDLSFSLPRGGIVGVIGPNGAGKTTLFRMITGQEQPDARRRCASATRSSSPTSTSRATRSTRRRRSGRRSPTASTRSRSATGR